MASRQRQRSFVKKSIFLTCMAEEEADSMNDTWGAPSTISTLYDCGGGARLASV